MAAPLYGMPIPYMFVGEESERTFQLENTLPSLPVPPLENTLAKYLDSVKAHLSDAEFRRTQDIVRKFATGVGAELHHKLVNIANHSRNWLFDWWEKYGYLSLRIPHAPYVNFGGPAPYSHDYWPTKDGTQCERAAMVAWYMLQFWQLLRKERLPIDRGGRKTVWSMQQFHRLFNGCKTPGETVDKLNFYFKTETEGESPTHLVVLHRGRCFTIVTVDSAGHVLTAPELEQQLRAVRRACEGRPAGLGLGALTAENRTTWHELRQHLISLHPDNERCLLEIQKSLFIIVLDDRAPVGKNEISREAIIGDAKNRWLDKAVSVIFFKNGETASNCDHAPFDAMVNVVLSYFVYLGLAACSYQWKGPKEVRSVASPKELVFHVDDRILTAVDAAASLYQQAGDSMEITCQDFERFGKKFIRDHNLHPDTFVQMAIHLGYYRLHGKPGSAYETASTRRFYHARTETLRSCTPEVIAWCRAMLDTTSTARRRLELLSAAMDKHNRLMAEAQDNHGCDRHLFGLQIVAMEEGLPMPELYTDPAYTKSGGGGNYILSTSCIGYTPVIGGVSPMCKDGYGFFYSIESEKINTFAIRWMADDTSATRLFDSISQSMLDMQQLLLASKEAKL